MPPDAALCAEVVSWMTHSLRDLQSADVLLTTSPDLAGTALFHCQQAAEKAIKGFLVYRGQTFRKTHSIEEVGEQALALDPSLLALIDLAAPLSLYAWKFRYPGDTTAPTEEKARHTLAIAQKVYDEITKRLPAEARPGSPKAEDRS
jgi:HEPN domain-containing protein